MKKITEKNSIQLGEKTEIQLFDVKIKIKEIVFNFENNKFNKKEIIDKALEYKDIILNNTFFFIMK